MTAPAAPAALTAAPGAPPGGGAPPGAPPDGPPFQSALETEWARTAIAEGQQQSHSQDPYSFGGQGSSSTSVPQPAEERGRIPAKLAGHRPQHALGPIAAGSPIAGLAPVMSMEEHGPGAPPTPATLPGPATKELGAGAQDTSLAEPPPPAGIPAAMADAAPTWIDRLDSSHDRTAKLGAIPDTAERSANVDEALLAGAAANPTGAATAGKDLPLSGAGPTLTPTPAPAPGGNPSPAHVSPSLLRASLADATLGATSHTGGANGGEARSSGSWSSQTGAHQLARQEGTRSAATNVHDKLWVPDATSAATDGEAGGVGAAVGTPVLLEGAAGAQESTTVGGNAQAPLLDSGVGLQQAIESLHGTIQLAAGQGLTQVRIALEPEGLGEIRIHLTQTAQGLLARISAETPVAAQALAAAHAELHQSLSSLGLNLARLNIGRHGGATAQDGGTSLGGGGRDGAAGSGEASRGGNRSAGQSPAAATPADPSTEPDVDADAQAAPASSHKTLLDVFA